MRREMQPYSTSLLNKGWKWWGELLTRQEYLSWGFHLLGRLTWRNVWCWEVFAMEGVKGDEPFADSNVNDCDDMGWFDQMTEKSERNAILTFVFLFGNNSVILFSGCTYVNLSSGGCNFISAIFNVLLKLLSKNTVWLLICPWKTKAIGFTNKIYIIDF